jgi:hypothetical protein
MKNGIRDDHLDQRVLLQSLQSALGNDRRESPHTTVAPSHGEAVLPDELMSRPHRVRDVRFEDDDVLVGDHRILAGLSGNGRAAGGTLGPSVGLGRPRRIPRGFVRSDVRQAGCIGTLRRSRRRNLWAGG